ncbi:MAG: NADH dehydrogenase (quinone) subunit D [bacterium]|nr:NADH dehydrogenase (quinone) subunit D [bacterium]
MFQQNEMTIEMGPQHPSTHGVLRLTLRIRGETVINVDPTVGYLHRGIEKIAENLMYTQFQPYTDRLDYISAPANNLAYVQTVEKLLGVDVTPRAKFIRVILAELARISSHLVWLATHGLDLGAMSMFLYCFRERELIMDLLELYCGSRLTTTCMEIGGVRGDISQEFIDKLNDFIKMFPDKIQDYETLLTKNRIWLKRTKGIGIVSAEQAINFGLTGPTLRGSGVKYDVRKAQPYAAYDQIDFEVPIGTVGDVYDRYLVRMEEMRQSTKIIRQALEKLPEGSVRVQDSRITRPDKALLATSMEALIQYCYLIMEGIIPPKGEVYSSVEGSKGELGFYIYSDGTSKPYRLKIRTPSFYNVGILPSMAKGAFLADMTAFIASIDIVLGEIDR